MSIVNNVSVFVAKILDSVFSKYPEIKDTRPSCEPYAFLIFPRFKHLFPINKAEKSLVIRELLDQFEINTADLDVADLLLPLDSVLWFWILTSMKSVIDVFPENRLVENNRPLEYPALVPDLLMLIKHFSVAAS